MVSRAGSAGRSEISMRSRRTRIGRSVQRTNQAGAAQAAFIEPRVSVSANVVQRINAVLGTADHDLAPTGHAHMRFTFGDVRERNREANFLRHRRAPGLRRAILSGQSAAGTAPTNRSVTRRG